MMMKECGEESVKYEYEYECVKKDMKCMKLLYECFKFLPNK